MPSRTLSGLGMSNSGSIATDALVDRRLRGSRTRTRILETARTLFGARGVAQVTVEEIMVTAGLSRATFYLHFTGKASVMVALLEEQGVTLLEFFRVLASGPQPNLTRVRKWVRVFVRIIRRNADMLNVIQLGATDERVRAVLADHRSRALAALGERFPAFDCRHDDLRERSRRFTRAAVFLAGLVGGVRLIALEHQVANEEAAIDAVAAELLACLLEPASG